MRVAREASESRPPIRLLSTNKSSRSKNFPQGPDIRRNPCYKRSPTNWRFHMALKRKRARRKGWSSKDLTDLKSYAKKKTPARTIGRHLKRSEGAVRQKAYAVGISLSLRKRRRRKRAK
jgi:hypothetical protein